MRCLREVTASVPTAITGAGTVLNAEQAQAAVDAGARFIVSPGLDDGVVEVAKKTRVSVFPGVATATEVQRAQNSGLRTVKFFPASIAVGPTMLRALSSVFRDMFFIPTGGVSAANLADYLAVPSVIVCGGSWLTSKAEVADGNFDAVTQLAKEAASIASAARV